MCELKVFTCLHVLKNIRFIYKIFRYLLNLYYYFFPTYAFSFPRKSLENHQRKRHVSHAATRYINSATNEEGSNRMWTISHKQVRATIGARLPDTWSNTPPTIFTPTPTWAPWIWRWAAGQWGWISSAGCRCPHPRQRCLRDFAGAAVRSVSTSPSPAPPGTPAASATAPRQRRCRSSRTPAPSGWKTASPAESPADHSYSRRWDCCRWQPSPGTLPQGRRRRRRPTGSTPDKRPESSIPVVATCFLGGFLGGTGGTVIHWIVLLGWSRVIYSGSGLSGISSGSSSSFLALYHRSLFTLVCSSTDWRKRFVYLDTMSSTWRGAQLWSCNLCIFLSFWLYRKPLIRGLRCLLVYDFSKTRWTRDKSELEN